jgi:hypothetical protein
MSTRSVGPWRSLTKDSILAAESSQPVTNGTSDKTFVDSNVLIYAHDVDAGRRHEIAKSLLRDLWVARTGVRLAPLRTATATMMASRNRCSPRLRSGTPHRHPQSWGRHTSRRTCRRRFVQRVSATASESCASRSHRTHARPGC